MDQFSRKIVGFAVNCRDISVCDLCIMFNLIRSNKATPKKLSTANAPLYHFYTVASTNLIILEIENIKSLPYTPTFHPYVERLIHAVRHEYLDKLIIWNKRDLLKKLDRFRDYYNDKRCHYGLEYSTPAQKYTDQNHKLISISKRRLGRDPTFSEFNQIHGDYVNQSVGS